MYYLAHQNAAGSKITVTATATGIYDLINTAASTNLPRAGFPVDTNAIDITLEDGDVRFLCDGNTPTSTNGILLSSGNVYYFRGIPLDKLKLIRVSGDVVCSVAPGKSDRAESTNASAFNVTLEAGSVTIGSVTADIAQVGSAALPTSGADAVSNTRTDVPTSSRISGFNGTTWDRIRTGITTVTATLTGWLNTLPWSVYNATPTTRTEGQGGPMQAASNGSLKVQDDAYESLTNSNRIGRIDPEWAHNLPTTEVLTNVPNGTPSVTYIDMEWYKGCSVHVEQTGGTDTFTVSFKSGNEGSTATDDYLDTYPLGWTLVAGSLTTDCMIHTNAAFKAKAHAVTITTAGGANDADFNLFIYKW